MYICNHCKEEFEEPNKKNVSYEEFYGVSHLFGSTSPMPMLVCPCCGDEDIEELGQCANCYEYFREEELNDTECMANGGIGYVCDQCLKDME